MFHDKCTSKFEFTGKWQRGFIFHMLDTSFLSGQDTTNRPTAKNLMQFIFQQIFCCCNIEYWDDLNINYF